MTVSSAWQDFFLAGEYRRALAAARLQPSAALPALESLNLLQEDVRAKRYGGAAQQLERLEGQLEALGAQAQPFWQQLDLARLREALLSLQGVQETRPSRPVALQEALAPAFAEPLTRAEAHNLLGIAYAKAQEPALAQQHFEGALEADPQHYRALSNLGNAALTKGDLSAAERCQREAISLNADFAAAHHNLGVVLRKKGDLSGAVTHLKKAQRLDMRANKAQARPNTYARFITFGLLTAVLLFWLIHHH